MLEPLQPLWSGPRQVVVVNLETPVTHHRRRAHDGASTEARVRQVYLNAPPYFVRGLRMAGVDAVTLANNHALDQGSDGLRETVRHARDAGLGVIGVGPGRGALRVEVPGDDADAPPMTTSVWNFYDPLGPLRPSRQSTSLPLSLLNEDAYAAVHADESAHVVVVLHVLGELVEQPEPRWEEAVDRFITAGAHVILLHGTHVPLQVEARMGPEGPVTIAWGLGNLLTDMGRMASPRRRETDKLSSPRTREGLLARVMIQGTDRQVTFVPVFETDDRFARWHGGRSASHLEEIMLWVRPLSGCANATELPAHWSAPIREEYAAWVNARREHLQRITRLPRPPCGQAHWALSVEDGAENGPEEPAENEVTGEPVRNEGHPAR